MNKYVLIVVVLFCGMQPSTGQSATNPDFKKALSFADYLFNTRQYDFAAQEYLKLQFLQPDNPLLKKKVLESFRLEGDLESGLNYTARFFDRKDSLFDSYYPEMVKILMLGNHRILQHGLVPDSTQYPLVYNESLLLDFMLSYDWEMVRTHSERIKESPLYMFTRELPEEQYLSPFLAASLSAIIPGSGKVYAKRWKDGLTSFLFVGLTAFQSYRGFSNRGIESAYGWVMGTLSAGFYLGNIYGSHKAARDYNTHLNEHYRNHVVGYYLNNY